MSSTTVDSALPTRRVGRAASTQGTDLAVNRAPHPPSATADAPLSNSSRAATQPATMVSSRPGDHSHPNSNDTLHATEEVAKAGGRASKATNVVHAVLAWFRKDHEEFLAYQRRWPFKTVVPEPPHTLREHVGAGLCYIGHKLLLAVFFLFTFPFWMVLHLLLTLLDRRQRKKWLEYQRNWPHQSVPHVRPVRYAADANFPIEGWHLRCEDGRQRWVYGEPLSTAEEGNELGRAQTLGLNTVEELHQLPATVEPPVRHDILDAKRKQREFIEQYQLGLTPQSAPRPRGSPEEAMRDGVDFLLKLQDPFSGHWPNDYSGCMFLTPGLIFTKFIIAGGDTAKMFPPCKEHRHVRTSASAQRLSRPTHPAPPPPSSSSSVPAQSETVVEEEEVPCQCGEACRRELIRYLRNYQNADGGWGQHTEGHSTMLGTVLSYVSMRLMGVSAADSQLVAARQWIHGAGGAVSTPMWGKVWLAILGLYSYNGLDPLPPEMILMPDWLPCSEGRAWCHSRVIAIPFSYFYGLRWSAPRHPVLESLKSELYVEPYEQIRWRSHRGRVCPRDLYTPTSALFKLAMWVMDVYERHPIEFIRRYALELNWKHMAYDDENTHFICLGPVNKSLNMLVTWMREGDKSPRYQLHRQRVDDYLFMGPTGMRMNGYNGSQLWDTSFAVQAVCACQSEMLCPQAMALAHHYVDVAQVQEDPIAAKTFYRHRTKGAWNFSTSPQGWQVSDCTAEGLRVVLLLGYLKFPQERIFDGVDEILSLRNASGDGGWASYESTRAPYYVELLNCAELFKDVMVEYSYAECSSSCIHSLALFRQRFPTYRRHDVDLAIREGIACVLSKQRPDGSFYGSWAVCFTYGAWIVADALRVSGELSDMANHPHCVKLIDFLLGHQNADGGWGEDINSCVRQVWVDNPDGSQVVNTAWSVMAIMCASGSARRTSLPRRRKIIRAVERGIQLIMSRQLESGDWAQERISGVFNGNNPIHYPGYKNSMTVWALGKYNTWWKKEYTL